LELKFHALIGEAMNPINSQINSAIRCYSSFRNHVILISIILLNFFGAMAWVGELSRNSLVEKLLKGAGVMLIGILLLILGLGPFISRKGRNLLIKNSQHKELCIYDFVGLQLGGIILIVSALIALLKE